MNLNLVEFSLAERSLLGVGLSQWQGPARPTSTMIAALRFSRPTFATEAFIGFEFSKRFSGDASTKSGSFRSRWATIALDASIPPLSHALSRGP